MTVCVRVATCIKLYVYTLMCVCVCHSARFLCFDRWEREQREEESRLMMMVVVVVVIVVAMFFPVARFV